MYTKNLIFGLGAAFLYLLLTLLSAAFFPFTQNYPGQIYLYLSLAVVLFFGARRTKIAKFSGFKLPEHGTGFYFIFPLMLTLLP
ncbi:MAG TPA: hypothetical protein VEA59_00555, partial [Patescibacteria group bacterium]|nr:hypothetical protein [Patescibacteria group bacterium]